MAVVTRDPVSAVDAFYDPLFAQLPLPAFLIDRDLKVASVNTEFQRSFLVSPDAVVGRNAAVLFVRDELPRLVALLGRLRRHELDDDLGGWDVHGPQGEVVVELVRRRDRALQCSFEPAQLFSALFDDAVLPMTLQDDQWRYCEVNAAFCTL
ncbi:MAG TPA: hypothetical protein PK929_14065, partial [Quisquiliibacterium sp.]|nr:hypothetical protein [Quisquiliibacterium sp.]